MPHALFVLLLLLRAAAGAVVAPQAEPCRDRFSWPFASTSIWNVPIGQNAQYVDAGIYSLVDALRGPPTEFHNDQDILIQTSASDPLVPWIDDSGNFPGMCTAQGKVAPQQVPIPRSLTTDCVANNNGAGILLPDNRTLIQMQPLYIPKAGGPIIAWYHTGAPQPFPWEVDILGDGALGAHGGSGLSSFGGALRLGELLPGAPPIRHALKLELWAHAYYFYDWVTHDYQSCYTWPGEPARAAPCRATRRTHSVFRCHLPPPCALSPPTLPSPSRWLRLLLG